MNSQPVQSKKRAHQHACPPAQQRCNGIVEGMREHRQASPVTGANILTNQLRFKRARARPIRRRRYRTGAASPPG